MPAPTHDSIEAILVREGGLVDDPHDKGGKTQFGISIKHHPEAWADGKVTAEEARQIFETKYINGPGLNQIDDPHLREQLADWSVNSGPHVAIQGLQRVLTVTVDGILGPETLGALARVDTRHVNNMVVAERIRMFCRIVKRDPTQVRFLLGWANRAMEWLL